MPFSRGVSSKVAPYASISRRRSTDMLSGITRIELVALHGGHHGQADAGVARGRLDDRAAGLERAAALGVFDHRQRDPVLDRAAGVAAFGLDPHRMAGAEQAVDADVRGAADGLENVRGFHGRSPGRKRSAFSRSLTPSRASACWGAGDNAGVKPARPPLVQVLERAHWRNVRTAQGSVAGNTCPPRGEDQSNRDESALGNRCRVKRAISTRSNTK